jgi:hypothetical protein
MDRKSPVFSAIFALLSLLPTFFTPRAAADEPCLILEASPHLRHEYVSIQLTPAEFQSLRGTSPQNFEPALRALILARGTTLSFAKYQQVIKGNGTSAGIAHPLAPDGTPLPPPIELPPKPDGSPNSWIPIPGSGDRPIKWKPEVPVPNPDGGQPSSSWDPHGHYDVDTGRGQRLRLKPDATPVNHDGDPICPPPPPPAPFPRYNPTPWKEIVITGVVVITTVIIILTFPESAPLVPVLLA